MSSDTAPVTGAPRDAYASRDFVMVSMAAVRALGSWAAAGCFQRIAWRAEREGAWTATMQEIADEICVSLRTAKRITQDLRDRGWVTASRDRAWDATLTWRVVWEDEAPQSANGAPGQSANGALSPSTETVETTTAAAGAPGGKTRGSVVASKDRQPSPPAAEREQMSTARAARPAPADEPLMGMPEPEQRPPEPNAGELVAAWCTGWSDAHGGAQPHGSVVRRVAGVCKNVAKDCADIEEWRAAWRAAAEAGRAGRYDVVAHLAAPAALGRQNHHLALARDPDQLTSGGLLGAMLAAPPRGPRALGGAS